MSAIVLDFRKAERILRGPDATRVREARLRALMGPKQPFWIQPPMLQTIA